VLWDLDLFSYDLIDDLGRSFRRAAPGVSDRRGPSLSFRDMLTHSSNCGLYFLDCERPPRVCDFRVDRRLDAGETSRGVRTRPGASRLLRAPSPGTLAFDAAMRGEGDRRVDVWDSHAVPARGYRLNFDR
jgi:hypothetical protein